MRLAIYDYGIGGFGLYKLIKEAYPDVGITYFSDSGYEPYGQVSEDELKNRVDAVIKFLKKEGCEPIFVACHSASTVVNPEEAISMIEGTYKSISSKRVQRIGVIGGGRTVDSGIYKDHFKSLGHEVKQCNSQILSILIEAGKLDKSEVREEVSKIITVLGAIDTLLLACTHYPVLMDYFKDVCGSGVEVVDPMQHIFDDYKKVCSNASNGSDKIFTTGSGDLMKTVVSSIYGIKIAPIEVDLG